MPNVKIVKRKSKNLKPKSIGMISTNQLRTILAVEEANTYEPLYATDVKIEGYDPNFSASVNAINAKLKHEDEFILLDFTKVNLIRIFYPVIVFSILIGIALL
jgi:hypothetical protein